MASSRSSTSLLIDFRLIGWVWINADGLSTIAPFHRKSSYDIGSVSFFFGRRGGSIWDLQFTDSLESLTQRPGSRWFFLGRLGGSMCDLLLTDSDESLNQRPGVLDFGVLFHLSFVATPSHLSSNDSRWCCTLMIKSVSSASVLVTLKLIFYAIVLTISRNWLQRSTQWCQLRLNKGHVRSTSDWAAGFIRHNSGHLWPLFGVISRRT